MKISRRRLGLLTLGACGLMAIPVFSVELPYRNEATRQLLIKTLKDEDRVQRILAVESLAPALDSRNAAELERVANDPVEAVRRQAAPSSPAPLGEAPADCFRPRPLVPANQISHTHRDPRIRQKARLQMLSTDPSVQPDFSKLLDDPDYFVRRAVSTAVVQTRGAGSIPIWQKLLAAERLDDRVEAAWAAGQLAIKDAEPVLLGFLAGDSERLKLISIDSLKAVGGAVTQAGLGEAILKQPEKIQEALIRLVIHLNARPALKAIRQLAADAKTAPPVRQPALDAVGAMADLEAKPFLLKIITSTDMEGSAFREHAARALGKLGGLEAVAPLKRLASEKVIHTIDGPAYESETTRAACITALEELHAVDALQSLAAHACLAASSELIRRTLAESLTRSAGKIYDYRRDISFRTHFIESLDAEEHPPDLAENLKKPPIFLRDDPGTAR